MSNTPVQPDYEKVMQEFHAWVRRRCSYEVIDPDPNKPRIDFIAERDMRQYFAEDDHRRLTEIIRAFFPNDDTICAEDIYPEKLAVFCTLLRISKGPWIEHFRHYDTLSDTKLPFSPTKPPEDWPEDPDDHEFLQKFCQAQWKFHVPIMQRPFRGKQFKKEQILPIISKTALNTGSSGNLWLIKVHPDYNQLITDDEKKRLGDDANTFVLKEYFTSDAEKYYNAEVNAFRRLGSTSSIIGFRGSFARGDCLNLILEWADKKTLEDYFRDVQPPADGEEIIQFWEALSKIIDALMKIHCAKPDDAGGGRIILGWHQDVKPANILVVSNGCNNPREWQFKLADLGTSHFNRVDQLRRNSTATNTQGTRTYGAPECCSPDNVSENDQLRVGQNVDIWSLGCIYSEAARWLKDGYQGILGYRRERSEETSRVADFEDADCFHNGERVLESVRASHRKSTKSLRQEDFITKPVIDHLVRDMLQDAVARPTALVLAHKSKQFFQEARQNLGDANRPPTTPLPDRKARRFQTVPTPGPPPPPKLPLSEAAFPGLMNFVAMPQTPEGSSNPHLTKSNLLTPTSLPDDDDEQQSQSPDEMTDFNDDTPTKRPASYSNQHQPEPRATRRRSLVGSLSLRKRGRQPTESVDETATGRSIKSDTSDVTLPTGNGTRASNDQATNRYSTGHGLGLSSSGTKRVSIPPSTGHGPSYLANNQGGQNDAKIPAHHRREDSNNSLSFLTLPSGQRSPSLCENKHRQAPPPIVIQRQTEPPTAPPATWTIQEALKWKKDKKNTNKPIPNPDLLNRLKGREHVFLVDDSLSMNPHWENVLEVFEALSYIVKTADPNGLDLHFTVSEDNCLNCKETTALIRMVRNRIRRSTTDMNIRLTALLQAYQKKLSKKRLLFSATVRPMNLYILTDGVWEAETNVEDPIRSLVQTLNEKRMGRLQVGIQFIYFGNNQRALERLEHLDSRLGLDPDIVDHESANGNVWKMLFGSTNATFDSVNENRSSVMSTPTDRSRSPTMSDKEYK